MARTSPTLRQRELGKRLRELRNQRGLTVDEVAEKLLCSGTKISRLETGARRPSLRDVRDLCTLYEVDEATSAGYLALARQAREQGWWTRYENLNLSPYIGLEQVATAITCYAMNYVPALLQTREYAQAVIGGAAPEKRRQRAEVWLRRQQLLDQDRPPRYRALLDEAVVHRRFGGPEVMAGQLGKIVTAGQDVRVIPFGRGGHVAQDSNFVLLEFEDLDLSPVVFIEGLAGNQYLEREAEIARYREAIGQLRDSALDVADSVQLIQARADAYASETQSGR